MGDKEVRIGKQLAHIKSRYNNGLLDDNEIEFFASLGIVPSKEKNTSEK